MSFIDYGTIWVCTCCMLAHAADGCGCEGMQEDAHKRSRDARGRYDGGTVLGDGFPLSAITGSFRVSLGMRREEHSCREHIEDDPDCDAGTCECDTAEECECERDTFSTSQCEGCGSYLHGERHAMWLYKEKRPRRARKPQTPVCEPANTPDAPTPIDAPNGPQTSTQDVYAANGVAPCQHCGIPGGH